MPRLIMVVRVLALGDIVLRLVRVRARIMEDTTAQAPDSIVRRRPARIAGDMAPGSIGGPARAALSGGVAARCIPTIGAAGMATCGMMPMAMRTTIRDM